MIDNKFLKLAHQLIHVDFPRSMYFIGLVYGIVPFPLFNVQSDLVARILAGIVEPPTREELLKSADAHEARVRDCISRAHHLADQWSYCEEIARLAGRNVNEDEDFKRILATRRAVYEDVARNRPKIPGSRPWYRDLNYSISYAAGEATVTSPERGARHLLKTNIL